MKATLISHARLLHPGGETVRGDLLLDHGRIARLNPRPADCPPQTDIFDATGRLLTPGLVDLHVHGIHTFNFDRGPDELLAATEVFGQFGTTCVVPTLLANKSPQLLAHLERVSSAIPKIAKVSVPGLHLEGPFVTVPGAGCVPLDGDISYLNEMIAACGHRVAIMSVAPDTRNIIPVIERLREFGVVPFITHTKASGEQTLAAIEAGARHATHFFNVFYPPPARELGVYPIGAVEAILADPRATCDIICDGVHVEPLAIRFALAIKGPAKVSLITDANTGAGLPPCVYPTPWGYPVKVHPEDAARIDDPQHAYYGALAGSSLTMDRGIRNLLKWGFVSPEWVWAMGSRNPANVIGLNHKGSLAEGADADVVVWDDDLTPAATWVGGDCVYRR